jgi:hypothetical protein
MEAIARPLSCEAILARRARRIGRLVRNTGGVWAFDYVPKSNTDDELGFTLDKHLFKPGEYESFREHDGITRTFRIVSVVELD